MCKCKLYSLKCEARVQYLSVPCVLYSRVANYVVVSPDNTSVLWQILFFLVRVFSLWSGVSSESIERKNHCLLTFLKNSGGSSSLLSSGNAALVLNKVL